MIELAIKSEYKLGTRKGIVELDDCFYIPVRITGSGLNVREGEDGAFLADRQKTEFFSQEALEHYKTLPVLAEHPDGLLTAENLKEHPIIGNVIDAWIKDDDVVGIARIFDKSILAKIRKGEIKSTSPGFFIDLQNNSGDKLDEVPLMINHLAFCEKGHWDSEDSQGLDASEFEKISLTQILEKGETMAEVKTTPEAEVTPEVKTAEVATPEAKEELNGIPEGVVTGGDGPKEGEILEIIDEADIEDLDAKDKEEVAEDEETEVIESEEETEDDRGKDEALDKMRSACDSAHSSLGVKMPHITGRQTKRSVVNKFLQLNRSFVSPKYRRLTLDSFTSELAGEVLNDTLANIAKKSEAVTGRVTQRGFVNTGKGYLVDRNFLSKE